MSASAPRKPAFVKAPPAPEIENPEFEALGLTRNIASTLAHEGITTPSPVQVKAIPLQLTGKDLIASAPTGTGKTAAFLLPALMKLSEPHPVRSRGPRVLVLTPTRELAQQVAKAAQTFSRSLPRVKTVCVTGGESYRTQNLLINSPHEILVATPGRLMDQMNSGRIDFSRLEVLILDEADRMLDMGFSEDVLSIAQALPKERQTVCFTATLSHSVKNLADELLNAPEYMEVAQEVARHDAIDQHIIYVDNERHKRDLLSHWLADHQLEQAIVFTSTKRNADDLAEFLEEYGMPAVALHGDLVQRQRTRTLNQLRRGQFRVLVATDVAARGIDVSTITHVFNYDLPRFAEDYVHRIGRTGRAGATGTAISFAGRDDMFALRKIERFIGQKIKVSSVEGMEAEFKPSERPAGGGGKRKPFGKSSRGGDSRGPRQGGFGQRDSKPRGESRGGDWGNRSGGNSSFAERRSNWNSEERPAAPRREWSEQPSGGFGGDRAPRENREARPARQFNDRPERGFRSGGDRPERREWQGEGRREFRGGESRGESRGEPRREWQPAGEWRRSGASTTGERPTESRRPPREGNHRHEGHTRPNRRG